MADNRCSCQSGASSNAASGTVCIDTYRVIDSCRDRDCYEDSLVILTSSGQQVVSGCANVRVKGAELLWASLCVDPIQFNRGFYQISIRYYVKISVDACTGAGCSTEYQGLTILDKRVVLYGGEGNANVFKSNAATNACCCAVTKSDLLPTGVVEAVNPVILGEKICDVSACQQCYCCQNNDIPEEVRNAFCEDLVDPDSGLRLYVSLGLFSVVRLERPAQYLISATDYCVPDKECVSTDDRNPCSYFRNMAFPINEFCPQMSAEDGTTLSNNNGGTNGGCGCGSSRRG